MLHKLCSTSIIEACINGLVRSFTSARLNAVGNVTDLLVGSLPKSAQSTKKYSNRLKI